MPISKKIIDEVNALDIRKSEKDLLVEILNFEDEGLRNYTKKYEETIRKYIKENKEDD